MAAVTGYANLHSIAAYVTVAAQKPSRSWAAGNGNGTYSNPLFYDEFSDPDMIRVGQDYYLNGTTLHAMPGLPILHSRDLVNWRIIGYAFDRLDLAPDSRLEEQKEIYGQVIWAPSFRYHNGTWYIFANVIASGSRCSGLPILVGHGSTIASSRVCTIYPSCSTTTERSAARRYVAPVPVHESLPGRSAKSRGGFGRSPGAVPGSQRQLLLHVEGG